MVEARASGRTDSIRLVLASASPRRLALLQQIGVTPDEVIPADIDEAPGLTERPREHALRLAQEKCAVVATKEAGAYCLAADTVVAVGRRILPKVGDVETARRCLEVMSGRSHDVFTGVSIIAPNGRKSDRVVRSRVTFKRLSALEMEAYLLSGEWDGKAGGYAIQGRAAALIEGVSGSYTGIVGLPLHETYKMLTGLSYPVELAAGAD